jgi:preprotein translocase subunit SecD
MSSPSARQQRPRSRLGVAIIAGGLALVVALVAVSAVSFVGADNGSSESEQPPAPETETTEPANEPDGPPAKVELRPVLEVLARPVDCRRPDVWCAEFSTVGGYRLGPAELRTADIVSAAARLSDYGDFVVGVTLSDAGAERFERVTKELAQNTGAQAQLAIVVDGLVISAPTVQGPIPGGEIDISADFTQEEAERLAAAIDP